MVGQAELALRVGAAVFVIVAPTLLFLGLWRGLDALRDDELVEMAREQGYLESSPSPTDVTAELLPDTGSDTVVCEACGTDNLAEATYCQGCLRELPSGS
ncbi:DUF7577 domain-containing protein [Halomicrobium salinisoli]|uniref:DUF7577 domain-containing protein n=1 Tax=Halomicrobium salinisoli TaxID=2878391 RepID=UPI001CF08F89|nr:zinc ribbon domain-containing protein [Halomicrobium salinisoli]